VVHHVNAGSTFQELIITYELSGSICRLVFPNGWEVCGLTVVDLAAVSRATAAERCVFILCRHSTMSLVGSNFYVDLSNFPNLLLALPG